RFGLRMDKWVAINLACGCQQKTRVIGFCYAERIVRSQRAGFHRLNREVEIRSRRLRVWTGWRCKVKHSVHFAGHKDVIGNVVPVESELAIAHQVSNVFAAACDEVIEADDFMSISQQAVTEMGAEEPRGSCDQNSHEYLMMILECSNDLSRYYDFLFPINS